MNTDHINNLIEKYWQGEATLNEELQLRQYYREGHLHDEATCDIMQYFEQERDLKFSKTLSLPGQRRTRTIWLKRLITIAASFLLLMMIYQHQSTRSQNQYVVEDPQEALEVTKDALAILNGIILNGESKVIDNLKNFEKTRITYF